MDKKSNFFKNFKISKRSVKYGSISIALTAIVVAIAVIVNLFVGALPSLLNTTLRLDLTPNKLYSLGDVSKDILKNLGREVTIYGLFDDAKIEGDQDYKEIMDLLHQYNSYPKVTVEYVDPDKNPGFLKDIDQQGLEDVDMGDFIVKSDNKVRKLEKYDIIQMQFDQQSFSQYRVGTAAEQKFTGAIKYVSSEKTPVLYITQGHGEEDIGTGYEYFNEYMKMNNYDVKTVSLLTEEKVPEDTDILMVLSPKKDLAVEERDKIRDYLHEGGKAIFMFDSLESDPELKEFENLLADYNVSLNYDKVKENDAQRHVPDNEYDIVPVMKRSDIISEPFEMIMPKSRSLDILKNEKEYIEVNSLLQTSEKAEGVQIEETRGDSLSGPLDLAVSVDYTGGAKPVKLLVMGNGSFISDQAVSRYGSYSWNGFMFFLSSLNWMQDKSSQVTIAPKMDQNSTLAINALQARLMQILTVIVLPLLILGAGLFVYLRRRHL